MKKFIEMPFFKALKILFKIHHFIEHWLNSNIIFRTSNELKRVHLLMIELKNPIFGFERLDIEHKRPSSFTRFTKLFIEQTQTSFFWTLNGLERVHLLVIEHPIFGFQGSNFEHSLPHYYSSLTSIIAKVTNCWVTGLKENNTIFLDISFHTVFPKNPQEIILPK